MLLAALSISACSTVHYVAVSDDLYKRLARCERPQEIPAEWVGCGSESCRRSKELPVHVANATKHHRCVDLIEDVKTEADNARAQ